MGQEKWLAWARQVSTIAEGRAVVGEGVATGTVAQAMAATVRTA